MDKDRKKRASSLKRKSNDDSGEQNIVQEVLKMLQQLFEARLIEKISRPIDKQVREAHIDNYGSKLQILHQKLQKIKLQVVDFSGSDAGYNRNKSAFGEMTSKPQDLRKIIRNIQSKYIQVLIDGSFKYFKKISISLNLNYNKRMTVINIEQWAASCLDSKQTQVCC